MSLRTLKRRRLECKTDYNLRLNLLKSNLPRIVIRRTNKYFIIQVVESFEAQDKVNVGITSKDLIEQGWDKKLQGSLKSIPAGYLTGLLLAKKIGKGEFIVDLGMAKNHYCGRLYSVLAGVVDGGLKININKKVFPSREKLLGKDLKPAAQEMILKLNDKLGSLSFEKKEKPKVKK